MSAHHSFRTSIGLQPSIHMIGRSLASQGIWQPRKFASEQGAAAPTSARDWRLSLMASSGGRPAPVPGARMPVRSTSKGRVSARSINLSEVFAGQTVGVK
jgi:hypothetical protein